MKKAHPLGAGGLSDQPGVERRGGWKGVWDSRGRGFVRPLVQKKAANPLRNQRLSFALVWLLSYFVSSFEYLISSSFLCLQKARASAALLK
jgi:hypothetical protein